MSFSRKLILISQHYIQILPAMRMSSQSEKVRKHLKKMYNCTSDIKSQQQTIGPLMENEPNQ